MIPYYLRPQALRSLWVMFWVFLGALVVLVVSLRKWVVPPKGGRPPRSTLYFLRRLSEKSLRGLGNHNGGSGGGEVVP